MLGSQKCQQAFTETTWSVPHLLLVSVTFSAIEDSLIKYPLFDPMHTEVNMTLFLINLADIVSQSWKDAFIASSIML